MSKSSCSDENTIPYLSTDDLIKLISSDDNIMGKLIKCFQIDPINKKIPSPSNKELAEILVPDEKFIEKIITLINDKKSKNES